MHERENDSARRRASGPATLSRAIQAQRGDRARMAATAPNPYAPQMVENTGPMYAQPDLVVHDDSQSSSVGAVVAACVAGAIGALVWFGVAAISGYEIGWIAWGVGAMVGAAYHRQGGNPTLGMATCAAIAVLAIVSGKYMAFQTTIDSELEALHESGELSQMYVWLRQNAARYNDAVDKAAVARELAAQLWHDGADPSRVDPEEVASFQSDIGPLLERVPGHETYEQFRSAERPHFEAIAEFGDMFDFMDIVFLAFGVISAIKLANGEQA